MVYEGWEVGRQVEFFEIFLSSTQPNENIKRLLQSEIVWLALPWKGMISLVIKEAGTDTYNGGGPWWRGTYPLFIYLFILRTVTRRCVPVYRGGSLK